MKLRMHGVARAVLAVCAGVAAAGAAQAQVIPRVSGPLQAASGAGEQASPPTTYVAPSVSVLVTQTDNSNYGLGGAPRSDTLIEVAPRLFLDSEHARWQVQADIGLHGIYYRGGTEPSLVAPDGSVKLHSEVVDHFVYFDAGMLAQQAAISPYVGQGGPLQGPRYTSTQWHVEPYIDRELQPGLRLQAHSDATWTHVSNTGAQSGVVGGRYLDQLVRLDQTPLDWGYGLVAEQSYSTYNDQPYASFRDTTARGILNYAVTPQWVVGVIGGREKAQAYHADETAGIYGVRTQWRPNQQQRVDATVEHRFFGTGWDLAATGGTPLLRYTLNLGRGLASYLAPLGGNTSSATNISTLLGGLLTSQYPNPLQRAQMVQSLLGDSGLPAGLPTVGGYYTSSTVLQNSAVATVLLLHQRDSYALSLYRNRREDLFLPGQQVLQLIQSASNDNIQTGAAFNYGHRLTPLDTMNVTLQRELNTGFGLNEGTSARQSSLILQLDHKFTPGTVGLIGARRRLLRSTVVGDTGETAIFAGLVHRF
jgi:uncharacterized protein (PEP-CTERM system associated)